MNPTLPQNDPKPETRAAELAAAASEQPYAYDRFLGVATASGKAPTQAPEWLVRYVDKALDTTVNTKQVSAQTQTEGARPTFFQRVKQILTTEVSDLPETLAEIHRDRMEMRDSLRADIAKNGIGYVFEQLKVARETSPLTVHAQDAAEYEQLFATIEAPGVVASYRDDAVFAQMRVAGPNPMMIRRMTAPDPRFPVTNAQFQAVMGEWDDLTAAMDEGRVYIEDLTHFEGAVCGTFPHGQKYLAAPLAMFAVPRAPGRRRALCAVAIQCMPTPGPDNPVFTPADGIAWLMAKTALTVADGNMHQAVSHLGRTHLCMAPFILATRRRLASNHPLRVLLHSHFEGTLGINKMADDVLCKPEGGVDSMLAFTIEGSREAAAEAARTWHFNDRMLHAELKARGVDDPVALPDYPYRDDALLVWDALERWVGRYLRLYYGGDADVRADTELAAWAAEIVAEDGGRILGFGEDDAGAIRSLDYLVRATTHIIFTAGPQHSAVNFPQYEAMSFAMNYPLAMYTPPPSRKTGYTEADYLAMLPTLDVAQYQLNFGYLMGTLRYLRFGEYPRPRKISVHRDKRVAAPLAELQADLETVERTIRGRNTVRPVYDFLLPSKITHSLNI